MNFYFGQEIKGNCVCINHKDKNVIVSVPKYLDINSIISWIKKCSKDHTLIDRYTYMVPYYDHILSNLYYNYYYYVE